MMARKAQATAPKRRPQASEDPTRCQVESNDGASKNPLLAKWATPFEMPPFDRVHAEHFMPAFDQAFADNVAEIETIAKDPAKPTFAEHHRRDGAGRPQPRSRRPAFSTISPAPIPTTAIQTIERKVAPRFAKHGMRIYQNAKLFRRVDAADEEEGQPRPHRGAGARAGSLPPRLHPIGRRARRQGQEAHGGDRRAAGHARHQVQPERAGGRAGVPAGAGVRGRARRPAGGGARGGCADRQPSADTRASMPSACRARASSRSCSSRPAATCASRRSRPGGSAAPTAARPTTARSWPRC